MPDAYGQLLDATIQHLEDLKTRGVRHVAVSPETLRSLARPPAGSQIPNLKSQMEKPASTGTPSTASARTQVQKHLEPVLGGARIIVLRDGALQADHRAHRGGDVGIVQLEPVVAGAEGVRDAGAGCASGRWPA